MQNEVAIFVGIKLTLKNLTNEELVAFKICLDMPDQKSACASKSWFPKVEHLFTQGERLHQDVFNAISVVIMGRIS